MVMLAADRSPRVSVIVAARSPPETTKVALESLLAQSRANEIEVLVVDGSIDGCMASLVRDLPQAQVRYFRLPGRNLPALKGNGIQNAQGELIAVLDPSDAADPGWIDEILGAFDDPGVWAAGGSVLLSGPNTAGNVAAYLFEYGAFNPPIVAGDTVGDLPGNNVAYRREVLMESCGDILMAEGFNKPFFHERIRTLGGRLIIQPTMCVRHLTNYAFFNFGMRRFHYARCFGAVRTKRASPDMRLLYRVSAPLVVPMLIVRHLKRAVSHAGNRGMLPRAVLALCGVCAFWGLGEWMGCWFGAGRSCLELY